MLTFAFLGFQQNGPSEQDEMIVSDSAGPSSRVRRLEPLPRALLLSLSLEQPAHGDRVSSWRMHF